MYNYQLATHILSAYNRRILLKLDIRDILDIYSISRQTLYNWIKYPVMIDEFGKRIHRNSLRHNTNSYKLKEDCHPSDKKHYKYIVKYVSTTPQFSIKQLLKNVMLLFNKSVSRQTIYNILKKYNITHKRIQINSYPHTVEKYNKEINKLKEQITKRKHRIISIDETGINLLDIRKYGWSEAGKRCIIKNNNSKKDKRKYSLLFGMSMNKIVSYKLKEGGINGKDFSEFMKSIHKDNGKYHYLMDNASIHHSKLIPGNIKSKIIYNIPYSPQFNPIELVNNELKRQLRNANIENRKELEVFIERFIKEMNKRKYKAYFNKSYKELGI